jgi:hypothetical protein
MALASLLLFAFTASPACAAFGFLPGAEGLAVDIAHEGPTNRAGSHPLALKVSVGLSKGGQASDGDLRDFHLELPPGLIENPTAVTQCSQGRFHTPRDSRFEASQSGEDCPDGSQVGVITLKTARGEGETRSFGLFNLEAPPGAPSQLGANPYGAPVTFTPSIRQADGEYGLTLNTANFPQVFDTYGFELTIWGTPWGVSHNAQRGDCLNEAEPAFGWSKCSVGPPKQSPPRAYLTLPTSCEGPLAFSATATSWQQPQAVSRAVALPALSECDSLPFQPNAFGRISNPRASSPSGYEFEIGVDESGVTDPTRIAPSAVRKAVVELPEGVTINPSVGSGLGICTPGRYAAETPTSPPGAGCPNESKIGDFAVKSPLIDETVSGSLFLAAPYENPFGSLIAIYLVAKSIDRGVLVKVAGELKPDPNTGRLQASFDRLPQLPYSSLNIHFREGQRSPLASPAACGAITTEADLSAWRDPNLTRRIDSPAKITAGIGGGPCPSGIAPFAPQASGGTINPNAGSYSPFYLHLTRQDTEQEITTYSATMPPGLLGKIAGVPYCPEAAIEAAKNRSGVEERDNPSCPAASRIGRTVSGYGLGPVLAYAPGGLYLAGPYHGSSFSVVAIDSALVGPFDLGTVIVRSAIRVDPTTAQVSIDSLGSDPIPHIIKGIPIHLRDVRAYIDRPQVTINPTNCSRTTLVSILNGSGASFPDPFDDSLASATVPFQASNCSSLAFKPKISLKLKGGTKRGDYPSLRVMVKPRPGDANIGKAQVTLPPTEFLAQNHIGTICTKGQFSRKACPAGSVYGTARAYTPLLEAPMEGPVYLRASDNSLPDLVFALQSRGIEVDLAGKIDTAKGGLRGTFNTIPDAVVSKFELLMSGGRRGVITNSTNLCATPQRAIARLVGQNNQGVLVHPRLEARCKHHKGKAKSNKRKGRR